MISPVHLVLASRVPLLSGATATVVLNLAKVNWMAAVTEVGRTGRRDSIVRPARACGRTGDPDRLRVSH